VAVKQTRKCAPLWSVAHLSHRCGVIPGGVVIDAKREQIPGLYAVGADMSDAYHQGYGGGLCLAIVTGRRAGRRAAAAISEARAVR
jgi:succinate dehydrogenase/fumarate reductase flavoprotein subunit